MRKEPADALEHLRAHARPGRPRFPDVGGDAGDEDRTKGEARRIRRERQGGIDREQERTNRRQEELVPEDVRSLHVKQRTGFLNSIRKREIGYHPPIFAKRKDGSRIELNIGLTATPTSDDVEVEIDLSRRRDLYRRRVVRVFGSHRAGRA